MNLALKDKWSPCRLYVMGEDQVAEQRVQRHMIPHTWRKVTAPYTNLNPRGTKNPSVNGKTRYKACYYYYWASQVALVIKNLLAKCRRCRFDPWVWARKILVSRKWQPPTVFLPGEPHEQRSLVGYSPWGPKESDTTE